MTRLLRAALAAALPAAAACAHVEAPEGGPVPDTPIEVVATRPDTGAVAPDWRGPVVIVFDRTLSERELEQAVSLSPRRGGVAVDHSGDELRVQPRLGWQPGTIYQVEVAPGIQDRFNNRLTERVRVVFSTGPAIPDTRAGGTLVDRVRGQPAAGARVDAIRLSDSLTYTTLADSAGAFSLAQVPEGEYLLLGYRDANRNRRPDPFEARDSVRVTLAAGAPAPAGELALLLPDSTPPVAGSARITDGWVEVRFDDHLDPEQPLSPEQVAIVGPDGAVAVSELRIGPPPAARDTAGGDTVPAEAPAEPALAPDTAGADTAGPARTLPSQSLFARSSTELRPDTLYTVTVTGVRNLHGLVGGGDVPLRTPSAAPPAPSPGERRDPDAGDEPAPPPPADEPPAAAPGRRR